MKFYSKNKYLIAIFILFGYFLFQSVSLIFDTGYGVPPDEVFHFNQINNYYNSPNIFLADSDILVLDNPDIAPAPMKTALYGTFGKAFFFYHWLMGKVLHFNFFDVDKVVFLRFVSLFLTSIYLLYFYKLSKLFFKNKLLVIFAFLIHTNIPMFVFMSSAISYDSLANLFAILSLFYVFKNINNFNIKYLLLALIFILLGTLTKISFLPLSFLLVCLLVYESIKNNFFVKFKDFFSRSKYKAIILSIFIFLLIFINLFIFFSNYYKYNNFVPSCEDIYSAQQCLDEHYLYKRTLDFQKDWTEPVNSITSFFNYTVGWYKAMIIRTFGYIGHESIEPPGEKIFFVNLSLMLFLFFFVRKAILANKKILYAGVIFFLYLVSLLFTNYSYYLESGHPRASIQGRYSFPVISLLIIFFSYYVLFFVPKKIRMLIIFLFFYLIYIFNHFLF
jgi:hypothetical protein